MATIDRQLERGLAQLQRLISEIGPEEDRNEAATRFDLIDSLLLDVLAWPREQVRPEEHTTSSGYADYVLGRPQRQLVVEAKREGQTFALPPETPRITSLPTLFRLDPTLKPVVEQARGYAADFGLPYAVVSNGRQLVAFLAVRIDGSEPLKGNALAFQSLAAMEAGFSDLWNGLSRPGVEGRRLSALLAREPGVAPPPKASAYVPDYQAPARSDELVTDLRMLGGLFLIDLVEHPSVSDDFLRQCYLSSGALSQHAAVGRRILMARYSERLENELNVDIEPARTRGGVTPDLLSDVAAASLSARPIILLGYVGVGKSMFIKHLVRIDAKDVLKKSIILSVDLGREPALEDLRPFIAERFIASLADDFGVHIMDRTFAEQVYARELEEFTRGPFGELQELDQTAYRLKRIEHLADLMRDREAHLRRSLQHLANDQQRQVVTILDNVDQRPAPVQDEVFLIAATLAAAWPGTVFVALRPDTFSRSKRSGTLKAYQPRVFSVAPPRIDRVLDKRITFAKQQIRKQATDPTMPGTNALTNVEALDTFLEIVRLSLRRSNNLKALIDNLSGQNARRAVELLTTVLGSPHTRPSSSLSRDRGTGFYSIPFHQFLRAVMLGERTHYDPASSPVPNLFDISSDDGREHFLLPIIISLVRRSGEPGVNEGFVSAAKIYSSAQTLGFRPDQVTWHLERAIAGELLEPSPLDGVPEAYRATSIGSYIEQVLLNDVTYVDEVFIDTPVVDPTTRAVTGSAERASERMQRADRFSRYLDSQWAPLAEYETGFDWMARSTALRQKIEEVEDRLQQSAHGRRRSRPDGGAR